MSGAGHGGSDDDWLVDSIGRRSRRCKVIKRSTGKRCGMPAMRDQDICRIHGGKTGVQLAHTAKRVAMEKAKRQLVVPDNVDPRDALAEELGRTVAWVRWLAEQVGAVDDTGLVWGTTKRVDKAPLPEVTEEAKPSIWWTQFVAERKHLIEVAKTAHACGVEDRRVELEVHRAELLVMVVTGLVGDLGLDAEDETVKATMITWLGKARAIEAKGVET